MLRISSFLFGIVEQVLPSALSSGVGSPNFFSLNQVIVLVANSKHKKKRDTISCIPLDIKLAATYSPTWFSSTIGANGLNFSVRNGKRWSPVAITTLILFACGVLYVKREITSVMFLV